MQFNDIYQALTELMSKKEDQGKRRPIGFRSEIPQKNNINMKTLEESIATAMDFDRNTAIVPFLPYLMQDFWELGTPPEIVINLVKKHCQNCSTLRVLDLGCGKGATSVKLAAALNCNCMGIDGIHKFIETAKEKAREYNVETLCRFEVGDIREKIKTSGKFDIIVLGAIGQVFGDYYATLTTLTKYLETNGIIIVNDAYIEDTGTFQHPAVLPRRELLAQIEKSEMKLIDEFTGVANNEEYTAQFENIRNRCRELMTKYPEKSSLFENYIQIQAREYDAMENEMICSMMVLKKEEMYNNQRNEKIK
jgi:ubiquinone/menaquinone biosynthesis C-methylase UbiE